LDTPISALVEVVSTIRSHSIEFLWDALKFGWNNGLPLCIHMSYVLQFVMENEKLNIIIIQLWMMWVS